MPFPPATLTLEGLACRRGERLLFADLSLRLTPGEAVVLTGANGAGKTSLLRIVAGLLRPDRGVIRLEAAGAPKAPAEPADSMVLVGTRDPLNEALSVAETLRFLAALHGSGGAQIDDAVSAFRLHPLVSMPCRWLSSGQRRRVALALLLLAPRRPVWLLDEPANALDQDAAALLGQVVTRHRERGGLVLAASHQPLGWPGLREFPLGPATLREARPA